MARKIGSHDHVFIGLDIDWESLTRNTLPSWHFLQGRAEQVPLAHESCDIVISGVALPYMNIPITLREIHRILKPGGSVRMSLHPFGFAKSELKQTFPKLIPTVYRLYVIANGLLFHVTGKMVPFPNGRVESWQTKGSMRRALSKTGFAEIRFSYLERKLIVEARKPIRVLEQRMSA
jgi:ubiquinone/menaquinone biosynthesis C-methylase UbiE